MHSALKLKKGTIPNVCCLSGLPKWQKPMRLHIFLHYFLRILDRCKLLTHSIQRIIPGICKRFLKLNLAPMFD